MKLYRRRYIPKEKILLKDDEILYYDKEKIITKWDVLKPRKDFSHGWSLYLIEQNFKISKFFDKKNQCIYIYCDIIETEYNEDSYIFNDLLADVIIYENGTVKIMDLGEIPEALDKNLITIEQAKMALRSLDNLLAMIYNKSFDNYIKILDEFIYQ